MSDIILLSVHLRTFSILSNEFERQHNPTPTEITLIQGITLPIFTSLQTVHRTLQNYRQVDPSAIDIHFKTVRYAQSLCPNGKKE